MLAIPEKASQINTFMQTIGERLEEARKRKGISLREAAEITKIRSDFLGYLEQNKFDFDLPEIYRRGFIKNYARYLKLDPEKLLTDYNAQRLSQTRGKRGTSEWFGGTPSAEAKSTETTEGDRSYGTMSAAPTRKGSSAPEKAAESGAGEMLPEKTFYLKIGLILAGTIALVVVLFGLVRAIIGDGPELVETTAATTLTQPAEVVSTKSFRIQTDGGTSFAVVRQLNNREIIFQGTLANGESVTVEKDGAVEIAYTNAEFVTIRNGNEDIRAAGSNVAGSTKFRLP